ncbi:MAG: hypothetical protein ACE5H0_12000, partial [Bacteroidota bacterium]
MASAKALGILFLSLSLFALAEPVEAQTFGYTTVGATKYKQVVDTKQGSRFTLSENGDVDAIYVNAKLGGGAGSPFELKGVIYQDNAGSPGAWVATGQAVTITGTQQWYTSVFSS